MEPQANFLIIDLEKFKALTNNWIVHEETVLVSLDPKNDLCPQFTLSSDNNRTRVCIDYINFVFNFATSAEPREVEKPISFFIQGHDCPRDVHSVSWQTKKLWNHVTLLPDFYYIKSNGYRDFLVETTPRWEDREKQFIWRGSTTGGGVLTLDNYENMLRYKLIVKGRALGSAADFGIFQVVQAKSESDRISLHTRLKDDGFIKSRLPLESFARYRFMIQIDGNGNSWELVKKLRLGCCMLLVDSDWVLWHYKDIEPWTHYVPVKHDLSDFEEKCQWCLINDQAARQIAENGRNYALNINFENEIAEAKKLMIETAASDVSR